VKEYKYNRPDRIEMCWRVLRFLPIVVCWILGDILTQSFLIVMNAVNTAITRCSRDRRVGIEVLQGVKLVGSQKDRLEVVDEDREHKRSYDEKGETDTNEKARVSAKQEWRAARASGSKCEESGRPKEAEAAASPQQSVETKAEEQTEERYFTEDDLLKICSPLNGIDSTQNGLDEIKSEMIKLIAVLKTDMETLKKDMVSLKCDVDRSSESIILELRRLLTH
jgi:hypothetical protein